MIGKEYYVPWARACYLLIHSFLYDFSVEMHSIVEYYSGHEAYKCGYCKSPDTNFSHGIWAHTMTVSDYQDLIDRGWRRSGKYCYKPTMDVTCCPMYTIRCRIQEFKATKSQKKVLKRFNKYMSGPDIKSHCEEGSRKMSTCSSDADPEEGRDNLVEPTRECQDIDLNDIVNTCNEESELEKQLDDNSSPGQSLTLAPAKPATEVEQSFEAQPSKQKDVKKGNGPDSTKNPCKKAKQLRRERKLEKLKEKGVDVTMLNINKIKEKQIEDFINDLPSDAQKRLQIKLVRTAPPSPEYLASAKQSHEVYMKYQMTIHNDKPEKCKETDYTDFLVKSPLLEERSETGPPAGYGSFHQQYWLDNKLIAVGVIDILPKCVSSVYFFYDPQYRNLVLGTYGALREIEFTRHLSTQSPQLKYYYMGFYIHSCPKMRYKGKFYPSDLLCPETFNWFPLETCIPLLEKSPYSRLNPDLDSVDTNFPSDGDLNYIPVLVKGSIILYKVYKRKFADKKKDCTEELQEYAKLVGAKAAKTIILVR